MEVFLIFFLLFLLGMLMWGVVSAIQHASTSTPKGTRTTGTVVRNQICWGRIIVERPVIRFQTRSGQRIERVCNSGVAFAFSQYAAGQSVEVIYNPADPTDFTIT